jgi:hypothetical protein
VERPKTWERPKTSGFTVTLLALLDDTRTKEQREIAADGNFPKFVTAQLETGNQGRG